MRSRKAARREEIAKLREEGAEAARAGKTTDACPRRYLWSENHYHWKRGYWEAIEDENLPHFPDS